MNHTLIIFDMDGTILNTLTDINAAVNYSLKKHNFPEKTIEETKWIVGRGMQYLIKHALPETASEQDFETVFADFMPYYSEHAADKTAEYPGITEAIKEIKKLGYKVAVNSNKPDKEAGILAEKYFPSLFDFVLGAKPEFEKKPSPDGVNFICRHFNTDISQAVYIGDSDIDLQTALNGKISFIGADWGFRGKDFLLKNGASTVAMNPAELTHLVQKLG